MLMAIARGYTFKTPDGCHPSGEMDFKESDRGEGMKSNRMDAITVSGNQAIITGSGRLADGTPVNYTAVGTSPLNFANGTQTGSTNAPCTGSEIARPSSDGQMP